MSTTALTIAVILYGVVTVALVAWFVHEASTYERKWRSASMKLSATYRREGDLLQDLEDYTRAIRELKRQLAAVPAKALQDVEPPVGSIIAIPGMLPWTREDQSPAPWCNGEESLPYAAVWSSDALLLRWGWGE